MITLEVRDQIELLRGICKANLLLYKCSNEYWHFEEALNCLRIAQSVYLHAIRMYEEAGQTEELKIA